MNILKYKHSMILKAMTAQQSMQTSLFHNLKAFPPYDRLCSSSVKKELCSSRTEQCHIKYVLGVVYLGITALLSCTYNLVSRNKA